MRGGLERAVAIGGSAGAVQALLKILPALPADYPHPVLVVVHVPAGRDNALVPLFQARAKVAVKEAEDKEPAQPGFVYFAPADYHLLVEADETLSLSSDEPVNMSRPAIDVLFESAADAFGARLTAVVLTGANADGAEGLRAVVAAGGEALVEDPADAYAPAMPEAALNTGRGARCMSLEAIASHLLKLGTA
ncbi:MAG: chemotaxis protein CheB [Phenylobacterium sp.]|nr:chemotaxis protein CheB [Phenylobacterium sp.]